MSKLSLKRLTVESLSKESQNLINSWQEFKKPIDRNDWHLYFILQAYLASTRSLDYNTQCGAVITKNNTVLSTGYNSFIRNIKDDVLPNVRPTGKLLIDKYDFMIHGEHNAILNCARRGIKCSGANLYVTGPPCCNCLQFAYQAGIRNVIFPNYNVANMTENEKYKIQFEILTHLMPTINIMSVDLDETTIEKIEKIKSCR